MSDRPSLWWRPERIAEPPSGAIPEKSSDSSVPFWALVVFTFILLLSPQDYFPTLASFRIALLTAGFAGAAFLLDRFSHGRPLGLFTREMAIVGGLVALAILMIPFSYWPGGSLSFLFSTYLKTLVIFWLLSNTVSSLDRLRKVMWGLSLMAVPLSFTAVRNFTAGVFIPETLEVKRIEGYDAPLTGNPNDLALMLNLILPLTAALFLTQRRANIRMMLLVMIVLDVIAVILTFSRGGFLTLAVLCLLGVWRLKSGLGRASAVAAMILFALGIALFSSSYIERLGTIVDIGADQTGSAQSRWNDNLIAMRIIARNPLIGAGLGMNMVALNEERGVADWTVMHNVYLEYAVDLGLVGLFLFLALLISCIKNAGFVRQQCRGVPHLSELFHFANAIELGLIAFSVAAFFYPVGYQFYFFYIGGLAVALKAIYLNRSAEFGLER